MVVLAEIILIKHLTGTVLAKNLRSTSSSVIRLSGQPLGSVIRRDSGHRTLFIVMTVLCGFIAVLIAFSIRLQQRTVLVSEYTET